MRIVFDDIIYSLQRSGGGSVYWTEVIRPLLDSSIHYVFDNASANIFYSSITIPNKTVYSSRFLLIKRFINPYLPEMKTKFIFHSSYFRFSRNNNAINITTVHDFTVERFGHGLHAFIHKMQQKRAVKKSKGIICVSENTKRDFKSFYPWYKGEICVIHNGYDHKSYYHEWKARTRNILFVGARTEYKRFDLAVKIASRISDCRLVIVGGGELSDKELELLNSLLGSRYEKKGFVNNDDLRFLYNTAFFLCYPSEYEGFGIPLLEAQACGCPVLCQKKSSIPEVVGDSALFFDASDIESAIEAVEQLSDPEVFKQYQKLGLENCSRFSWEKSASSHIAFYNKMWSSLSIS